MLSGWIPLASATWNQCSVAFKSFRFAAAFIRILKVLMFLGYDSGLIGDWAIQKESESVAGELKSGEIHESRASTPQQRCSQIANHSIYLSRGTIVEPLANINCWNKPVFSAQVKASFQTTAVQLRTLSRIFTFAKPVLCRCQSPSISAATGCTDDGVEGHNAGLTHCCAPGIEAFIGFLTFLWKSLERSGYSSVRLGRFKRTWSRYWHCM